MTTKVSAVYIHIPFCRHKCFYCDFNTYALQGQPVDEYLQALEREMRLTVESAPPGTIETIFIGGGTPTVLTTKQMEKLLALIQRYFPKRSERLEFSVEANPGTVEADKLDVMVDGGVNRISMGAQSFDDRLLKRLGRIHDARTVYDSVAAARRAGLLNLSIDLMFNLPEQTMEQLQASVDAALSLQLPHYSLYSLKIEENTPFHIWYEKGDLVLPDEDLELAMYEHIIERMSECGYKHYEISNFAVPGFESRHNQTYWKNESYYGLGAGAHGYVKSVRHVNVAGVKEYIEATKSGLPRAEQREVDRAEAMEDFMILGLRMLDGIERERFRLQFGATLEDVFSDPLAEAIGAGLLEKTMSGYRLTRKGLIFGNDVFAMFFGEAAKTS